MAVTPRYQRLERRSTAKTARDTILEKAFGGMLQIHNRLWSLLPLLLLCGALVYVHGDGAQNWLNYRWGPMRFRYPSGWTVTPQLYRTPPQEEAGEPPALVGLVLHPRGESERGKRSISIGGRQASCESFVPSCRCFTVYEAVYTCGDDSETLQIFDLLLKTIRYDDAKAAFKIVFPAAEDSLHPNTSYTIRWRTRPGLRIRRVDIWVHDTSKTGHSSTILDTKGVPNTGTYNWHTPSLDSTGPFLIDISFVKPWQPIPRTLVSGRIYAGKSNPFYIR
jgi:hypothetical protein